MDDLIVTPAGAAKLKEITIFNDAARGEFDMRVTLYNPTSNISVVATFEDVQGLDLSKMRPGLMLGPLKAIDMSERQMERIKYKVSDYEEEQIFFYCARFSLAD